MKRQALLAGLCGVLLGSAAGAEPITVAWRDKPPYHYLENGEPKGFLLARARTVFETAGLPARFISEPQKRIWANFQHGATNYCSISWYRLPEREAVAQYSQPFHEDLPHTILIAPGMVERVKAHATLASLLTDPTLTLGVIEGVSYGPLLDPMIKASKNKVMSRTVETTQMMRMLTVGRASYMFVDREDWEFFRQKEQSGKTLLRHDLPDMPPGVRRYIVCSRDVSPATMNKLNQAIAATGGMNNPGHSKPGK
ncbi:substrate-binding periplasmic protein [Duganella radicis]|uniref:Transporter substrate-binding domain-containing protein n=1 Tax=Duganella radicis TaxID=551988 RepID=A0A6L6PEA4_9BURK|nr:transporter substrate-binding domain-containing protein [Duganella radicis]MTV36947.1 transporter substrate-binding domain-containing protein [Duganella radicis]